MLALCEALERQHSLLTRIRSFGLARRRLTTPKRDAGTFWCPQRERLAGVGMGIKRRGGAGLGFARFGVHALWVLALSKCATLASRCHFWMARVPGSGDWAARGPCCCRRCCYDPGVRSGLALENTARVLACLLVM